MDNKEIAPASRGVLRDFKGAHTCHRDRGSVLAREASKLGDQRSNVDAIEADALVDLALDFMGRPSFLLALFALRWTSTGRRAGTRRRDARSRSQSDTLRSERTWPLLDAT